MEADPNVGTMDDLYRAYENLTDEEILLIIRETNDRLALDYLIGKYRTGRG